MSTNKFVLIVKIGIIDSNGKIVHSSYILNWEKYSPSYYSKHPEFYKIFIFDNLLQAVLRWLQVSAFYNLKLVDTRKIKDCITEFMSSQDERLKYDNVK